jgi:hypothetical protein
MRNEPQTNSGTSEHRGKYEQLNDPLDADAVAGARYIYTKEGNGRQSEVKRSLNEKVRAQQVEIASLGAPGNARLGHLRICQWSLGCEDVIGHRARSADYSVTFSTNVAGEWR